MFTFGILVIILKVNLFKKEKHVKQKILFCKKKRKFLLVSGIP